MAELGEYNLPEWAEPETPIPTYDYDHLTNPDNPWLPKTDWSRDGIIANED